MKGRGAEECTYNMYNVVEFVRTRQLSKKKEIFDEKKHKIPTT